MPTSANLTFTADKLQPAYAPDLAFMLPFNFPASIHYPKGQLVGEVAASPGTVAAYTGALVANPSVAPVPTEGGAGALGAGLYYVAYSYKTAAGESLIVTPVSVTIGASKMINVAAIVFPTGVTSANWYMSDAIGSLQLRFIANKVNGNAFTINALPAVNAAVPPTVSTAYYPSDGSQNPIGFTVYEITTDASGNITLGAQAGSEWGETRKDAPVWVAGTFFTADLTGLDANAVTKLGRLIQGTTSVGVIKI